MKMEFWGCLDDALTGLMGNEGDEKIILRHFLETGEGVEPHAHGGKEYIIFPARAMFEITVGEEERAINHSCYFSDRTMVIHIPAGEKHSLKAISNIKYFVIREKEEK